MQGNVIYFISFDVRKIRVYCERASKPGAEFKDADIANNNRFVERNGQIMYRMTCKLNGGTARIVLNYTTTVESELQN